MSIINERNERVLFLTIENRARIKDARASQNKTLPLDWRSKLAKGRQKTSKICV